jgi:hypothetical protein
MNTLIELRQRSKGYEPVETDDDYDAIPVSYTQRKDPHDILTDLKYEKYIDDINEHGDTQEPPLITKKKDSKLCKDFLPPLPSPSHSIRCLVPLLVVHLWCHIPHHHCNYLEIRFFIFESCKGKCEQETIARR